MSNVTNLFSQSVSDFKTLKLQQIDVNAELENDYDPLIPKCMQLDVERIYKKTGLPRVPANCSALNDRAKLLFMA